MEEGEERTIKINGKKATVIAPSTVKTVPKELKLTMNNFKGLLVKNAKKYLTS